MVYQRFQEPSALNLAVFVLTLYVLGALLVDTFWTLPSELSRLIRLFDNAICLFFLADFGIRYRRATDKKAFMRWGWVDLLASIPMLDILRAGRLLRLIRLVRIFRALQLSDQFYHQIFVNKTKGTLVSISLVAVLLIMVSSLSILLIETDPQSNIRTAEDAIWWTYTTITTVGYGDKFPVTTAGRVLAMILMTFGVGLFGAYTAYVASVFVRETRNG
jgi:voltage-gated potassium channel